MLGKEVIREPLILAGSGEKLAELVKTDELELLYLHLYSMRNFADMKVRLIGSLPAEADEPAAVS